MKIQMVDLKGQYMKIKPEVDAAIQNVIDNTAFINGPIVKEFAQNLSNYMGGCHVITCGNGTDALQIALMALDLKPGDEVIVPAFTYVASLAASLLQLLRYPLRQNRSEQVLHIFQRFRRDFIIVRLMQHLERIGQHVVDVVYEDISH